MEAIQFKLIKFNQIMTNIAHFGGNYKTYINYMATKRFEAVLPAGKKHMWKNSISSLDIYRRFAKLIVRHGNYHIAIIPRYWSLTDKPTASPINMMHQAADLFVLA